MNIEKLTQIYNTMRLIETKGNNTILMANCLIGFEEYFKELNQIQNKEGEINDSK